MVLLNAAVILKLERECKGWDVRRNVPGKSDCLTFNYSLKVSRNGFTVEELRVG